MKFKSKSAFFLQVMFLCLVDVTAARTEEDRVLLKFVQDAHRAARESIQMLSGRVSFTMKIAQESEHPVTQSCSSQYWFSPERMRAKISEHNEDTDYLWENSVRQSVTRQGIGGQEVSAGKHRYSHRHVMRCDPYFRGLLVFQVPNTIDCAPFEELVERAAKVTKVERKQVGGRELIVVQLFFDKGSKAYEEKANIYIYFDPNVNYLARKIAYTYPTHYWEEEVLEFKEHKPGLYFPERCAGSSQILPSKTVGYECNTRFTDIQINQPLPKDIFHFKYPQGVFLFDAIQGMQYQVDTEGNPISQPTPYGHEPPPPGKDGDAQVFGTETHEEPRPLSRWILPISFGILITGGVAAFLRRRRRLAESA